MFGDLTMMKLINNQIGLKTVGESTTYCTDHICDVPYLGRVAYFQRKMAPFMTHTYIVKCQIFINGPRNSTIFDGDQCSAKVA